jgi:hypothetical protein
MHGERLYRGSSMLRRLVFLIALAIFHESSAAPKLKDSAKFPAYFPTEVGAKWVYDESGQERVRVVTQVDVKDDQTLITIQELTGNTSFPYLKYSVSPKGVYLLESSTFKIEPVCVLRFPIKEGDTWPVQYEPQKGLRGSTQKVTVGKFEDVEVPAGKFKAIRVEVEVTAHAGKLLDTPERYVTWYAHEVGLIKTTLEGVTIRVLKSFSSGKK